MKLIERHDGVTLIELMVAVVILAILAGQLFLVFHTQKETYIANERALDAQEDARLVSDLVAADARMAGYMLPRIAGVASIDGGAGPNNAADDLCVSDWSAINDAVLATAADHFDRARVLSLSATTVTLTTVAQLNVDNDGSNPVDFLAPVGGTPGGGIILSNGIASHCAQITNISSTTITFDTSIPSSGPPGAGGVLASFNASPGAVRAVPAVIYRVTGAGMTRNGMLISSEIEDLQVEFGVDANFDDALTGAEFPVHVLPGNFADLVRSIRISVIAIAPQGEPDYSGPDRYRPATANRVAGPTDTFLRRRFVTSVLPRNML
jgi:prepilin-type N-terminal cleavage/methylation domain-containing protein